MDTTYSGTVKQRIRGVPVEKMGTLPHNLEAEQLVLGALLIRNDVLEKLSFLKAEHFYDPLHANIFEAISRLVAGGRIADVTNLRSFFENADPIRPDLSVADYLWHLSESVATTANSQDYARSIVDLATRRRLIQIAEDMIVGAWDAPVDLPPSSLIEQVEGDLFALAEGREASFESTLESAMERAIERINDAASGSVRGMPTGLIDLDEMMGGLQPSDLIVLAGRPSMGKTALATNIAVNVAHTKPVGFFSLEMSDEQIASRILASATEISTNDMRRGKITDGDMGRLISNARRLSLPIVIDQTGGISIALLSARARRMKRKHDIQLLIVDYIQLMQASKGGGNRVQDVTEITTGLKALAKELNIPVIALSQLSRAVEQRDDKRPKLSDLRESGSIEQDADIVLFVFREEYYIAREEPAKDGTPKHPEWLRRLEAVCGKAEIIIGKQRHGPTGIVPVAWDGKRTQFSNLAREGGREDVL